MNEAELMKRCQVLFSRQGARVFRNNSAMAWVSNNIVRATSHVMSTMIHPGDVLLRNARPLHAGLGVGTSDLIGWVPFNIGGYVVPVFTACEVKSDRGRATEEQTNFIKTVNESGGLGMIVRSEAMVIEKINEYKERVK